MIDIKLKNHNRTKEFFHKLYSKLEDITLSDIHSQQYKEKAPADE